MISVSEGRVGSQTPRLRSVPPASSSAGADAIDYAASVGLVLDPWQSHVLDGALGERGPMWAAFEVGLIVSRQNGKGAILEARELAGIELFGERLILHTAHELKTAEEARLRMEQICEASPDLDRQVRQVIRTNGKEQIVFRNGARIKYVARSKGSGRGFSGDLIVMDEAMFLTSEAMAALLPTMSARPNPQIWYTGSAGLAESTHLRMLRERGIVGDDPSLAYFEWSVDEERPDLDAVDGWYVSNPALGIRITEDFVRKERAALDDVSFARERLGLWATEGSAQVIDPLVWRLAADPSSQAGDPVAFAVDVTPDRFAASIAMAGARPDGATHVEVVDNREGTGWVVGRLLELQTKWNPAAIAIDPGGPAGALVPALVEAGVILTDYTVRQMAQACGGFHDDVIDGRLRHLDQPTLNVAVAAGRKRPLGDSWTWKRRDLTDISPLVAVTLARDALIRTHQPAVAMPDVILL